MSRNVKCGFSVISWIHSGMSDKKQKKRWLLRKRHNAYCEFRCTKFVATIVRNVCHSVVSADFTHHQAFWGFIYFVFASFSLSSSFDSLWRRLQLCNNAPRKIKYFFTLMCVKDFFNSSLMLERFAFRWWRESEAHSMWSHCAFQQIDKSPRSWAKMKLLMVSENTSLLA